MPKLIPRDYQRDALESARYQYENDNTRLLGRAFTGSGKTSGIACNIPDYFPDLCDYDQNEEGGLLFLAHRIEIIQQAYEKFVSAYPFKSVGLEQGENHATGYEDFIFASVDSLGRLESDRILKYKQRKFGAVITDEGHHVTMDSTWDNILNFFGVGSDETQHYTLKGGMKPLSLFLTATPKREDGQTLAPFVDEIAFDYDILWGIRNGWLVDIRAYQAHAEGFEQLSVEDQVDYMIKVWSEYAEPKRTLTFARSVAQSDLFARTLNGEGITRAAHVDAETDRDLRSEWVKSFGRTRGGVNLLTNRFVFTEGFDSPSIECILDNGPTKSQTLHIQKLGRGLRPHPEAAVDSYDTARERKEAIRLSPKEALLYISLFDPTQHGLDIAAAVAGWDHNIDAEGAKIVEEIVDVIELEEELNPEAPIRDITSLSDLEVRLKRVDVWSQTIQNEDLKALTPLRWVVGANGASIYLSRNPHPKNDYDDTPVIWKLTKEGEQYRMWEIVVGGWVEALNKPVRAQIRKKGLAGTDLNAAIKKLDAWLERNDDETFMDMKRGSTEPASDEIRKYLDRGGVSYGAELSQETAELLKDNWRIQKKLSDIDFESAYAEKAKAA